MEAIYNAEEFSFAEMENIEGGGLLDPIFGIIAICGAIYAASYEAGIALHHLTH